MRLISFVSLIAAVTLSAATAKPHVYRNDEFGITVPVPQGVLLCPLPDDEHDHGPVFLLGTTDATSCRDDIKRHRYISVFASYQTDDTKRLRDFLNWQCEGPCRPAPGGLRVPGLRSASARVDRPSGWIEIIVVTQAGTPDPDFDASIPSVNYELSLYTRPNHLAADLRVFRAVLQTIRLSPPPPPSAAKPRSQ
jgi:hypothetical protein